MTAETDADEVCVFCHSVQHECAMGDKLGACGFPVICLACAQDAVATIEGSRAREESD